MTLGGDFCRSLFVFWFFVTQEWRPPDVEQFVVRGSFTVLLAKVEKKVQLLIAEEGLEVSVVDQPPQKTRELL